MGKMNAQSVDPTRLLERTGLILEQIIAQNRPIRGSTVLEVGTGWKLTTPIALWLCGADKVITVDLNPYLRPDLVRLEVEYINQNQESVAQILGTVADADCLRKRLALLETESELSFENLMSRTGIEYLSPADAANLPDVGSIDYHISHTVFEHIPRPMLLAILQEANRLMKRDGLCVHYIDLSDHFSHRDRNISEVNFLQFNESEWEFWANNRYAYHNRLRVDDYYRLFEEAKFSIVNRVVQQDPQSLATLKAGLQLADLFIAKDQETNAATKLLISARKV